MIFRFYKRSAAKVSVDGDTRRLVEQGSGSWIGTFQTEWETMVDVTGTLIEGSTFCVVASGTITEIFTNSDDGLRTEMLTITRESADELWRVLRVDDQDGEVVTSLRIEFY